MPFYTHQNRIVSDEGYSVRIIDRGTIAYEDGSDLLSVGWEMLTDGMLLYRDSIKQDSGLEVDSGRKTLVANRVRDAFLSQNWKVSFCEPYPPDQLWEPWPEKIGEQIIVQQVNPKPN